MYYYLQASYKGYDQDFDSKLEKRIGRKSVGAGYGFGMRDISWEYVRKSYAVKALNKLKRFKRVSATLKEILD
jgi:hypothetical protein